MVTHFYPPKWAFTPHKWLLYPICPKIGFYPQHFWGAITLQITLPFFMWSAEPTNNWHTNHTGNTAYGTKCLKSIVFKILR